MSQPTGRRAFRSAADLARAMVHLPWALGLWGVQQTLDLGDPRRSWERSATSLDTLTRAAREPLEGPIRDLHRAGEHLQGGLIDSMTRFANGSWREPRAALDEAWGVLGRSWNLFVGKDGGRP